MKKQIALRILVLALFQSILATASVCALEPNEILVIANRDTPASVSIARDYCVKRGVPRENILSLHLGSDMKYTITRDSYEKDLAEPIRRKLAGLKFDESIKCLLTVYGVPVRVEGKAPLSGKEDRLKQLETSVKVLKQKLSNCKRVVRRPPLLRNSV